MANEYKDFDAALGEDLATKTTVEFARSITEQQLNEAVRKQKASGKKLWEILMSDMSLKSLKELLTYEIWSRGKALGEVIVENGYATAEELGEQVAEEAKGGLPLGEVLVDRGIITRAQLGQALIEQERTGDDVGRVLLNLRLVTAKQIADAQRVEGPAVRTGLRREQVAEVVAKQNLLAEDTLGELVAEVEGSGADLAALLVDRELVTREQLGKAFEAEWGTPYVELTKYDIDESTARLIPENLARNYRALPLRKQDNALKVAMADPKDVTAIDDLSMLTGHRIEPMFAWQDDLMAAIDRYFEHTQPAEPARAAAAAAPDTAVGPQRAAARAAHAGLDELVENASVTDLVASIVEGAIHAEATDIHLEPQINELRVRYRIDGMLYDVMTVPCDTQAALISRIKILANMDITQKRRPQDGHFAMEIKDRKYDMRIATLPTSLGERLVIRLLNPATLFLGMKQLGLSADSYSKMERLIHSPNGMILVTGPIGSGKTTTQYAALNKINVLTDSIVTIEDPIEYELPGINQVQVDPRIDCTFATILRAVLRQDVNKLLVGEVRDRETAAISVRAAVTGHLVFTTLHTRNAAGAITNLVNLDIPPFLVATSVLGIVNQRLVRRICQHCKEEYKPDESVLSEVGFHGDIPDDLVFARGRGCSACYHTGYRGRVGVFEMLLMTEKIQDLVRSGAPEREITQAAVSEGMKTLLVDAMHKVKKQITSVDEVARNMVRQV